MKFRINKSRKKQEMECAKHEEKKEKSVSDLNRFVARQGICWHPLSSNKKMKNEQNKIKTNPSWSHLLPFLVLTVLPQLHTFVWGSHSSLFVYCWMLKCLLKESLVWGYLQWTFEKFVLLLWLQKIFKFFDYCLCLFDVLITSYKRSKIFDVIDSFI